MSRIRIGDLRHRIVLQQNTPTEDPVDGAHIDGWRTVATVWGELLELSGREYLASREMHADVTATITIRCRSDIEPLLWRVKVVDTVYDIQHVIDLDGRHRHLQLMVSRGE